MELLSEEHKASHQPNGHRFFNFSAYPLRKKAIALH